MLVIFLVAVIKYLTKHYVRKEGFLLLQYSRVVCHGGEGVVTGVGGSWSHDICSQEGERDGCWFSVHLPLLIQFWTPAQGMVPPTSRVSLPIPAPQCEPPSQTDQRVVS